MANQDPMTGKWTGDGGGSYDSAYEADAASRVRKGGGGGGAGLAAVFLLIIYIVPIIIARVVSFVWGILFRLGVVGRILQSVIAGLVLGGATILFGLYGLGLKDVGEGRFEGVYTPAVIMVLAVLLGILGLFTLLYFYLIYPVFSRMGTVEFSNYITLSFKTMYTGIIAGVIIGALAGANVFAVPWIRESATIIRTIIIVLSLIAGVAVLISKSMPYIQQAIAERKEFPKQPIAAILSLAIVCGGIGFILINGINSSYNDRIARESQYQVGSTIIASGSATIYEEPDDDSTVVKDLNEYTKLTVTGDFVYKPKDSYPYIPVETNGVKGWVRAHPFMVYGAITGTATIIADDVYYIVWDENAKEDKKAFIPIGTKAEFIGKYKSKKTKEEVTYVWYDGRYLTFHGEGIRLDE